MNQGCAVSKGISKKTVAVVLERDHGLCVLQITDHCLGEGLVADHRANRGNGGAKSGVLDQPSNLIAACSICNGFKEAGADRHELEQRGVRVRGDSTHQKTAERARTTPVRYPDGRVFYLNDDGTREQIDPTPY